MTKGLYVFNDTDLITFFFFFSLNVLLEALLV